MNSFVFKTQDIYIDYKFSCKYVLIAHRDSTKEERKFKWQYENKKKQ